jgi:hypothetical protein
MPMSSYQAGKGKVELFRLASDDSENCSLDFDQIVFEPSRDCIDAILNFASQYEVLESRRTGNIELNLN